MQTRKLGNSDLHISICSNWGGRLRLRPSLASSPLSRCFIARSKSDILPHCKSEGIGVIVYSPMASGLLTGAMTREPIANLPKDDGRKGHPDFSEPNLSCNLALVERVKEIARCRGRFAGEVAVAWTQHHPAVTATIVGARNAHQAEGAMRAGELYLTEEEIHEIEAGLVAETAA